MTDNSSLLPPDHLNIGGKSGMNLLHSIFGQVFEFEEFISLLLRISVKHNFYYVKNNNVFFPSFGHNF